MRLSHVLLSSILVASATPAMAVPMVFGGFLTGPNEEPPNASPGTGSTRIIIDPDAHTLRVEVSFSGLLAPTTVAHIHVINGPGDANTADTLGPVATTTPSFPGFPAGVNAGTYDQTFDMTLAASYNPAWITNNGGSIATAEATLFQGIVEGRAYLNIHSSTYPAGEIRDFLVPEPAAAGLLLAALAQAAVVRRRR